MNVKEYVERFQTIEKENSLFDLRDENGIAFWDVVRYHVYQTIYFALDDVKITSHPRKSRLSSIVLFSKNLFHTISCFFFIFFSGEKKPYLVFNFSRYKDADKTNVDYVTRDVVDYLGENATLFENYCSEPVTYKYVTRINSFPTVLVYIRKLCKKIGFFKVSKNYTQVEKLLNTSFNVQCNLSEIMSDLCFNYRFEFFYYQLLFKRLQPQIIFVVMTGGEKAICAAAKKNSIPVAEIQHCLVNYYQPYYSYPAVPQTKDLITNPSFILTFADFWTMQHSSPVSKVSIGNNYYYGEEYSDIMQFDLLIITANIYQEDIGKLLDEMLSAGYNKKVVLKLHPNQLEETNKIREKYAAFPNISVILSESSLDYLIQVSDTILSIQSTGIYQALNKGKKVIILKRKNFQVHDDVFNVANVYLIDSVKDFFEAEKQALLPLSQQKYFEPFQSEKFTSFLQSIDR